MPIIDDKIVTLSDDGTNIAFGLLINARKMKNIAIIFLLMGILANVFNYLLYAHSPDINILPSYCKKYYLRAPMNRFCGIKNGKLFDVTKLDLYTNEDDMNEDHTIDSTNL